MKSFKVISLIIATMTSLTAGANELVPVTPVGGSDAAETRSPLTDWDAESRRATAEVEQQPRRENGYGSRAPTRPIRTMVEVGVGREDPLRTTGIDLDSGWNVIISVKTQIDARGIRNYGRDDYNALGEERLMFLQVSGRMAVGTGRDLGNEDGPGRERDDRNGPLPYLDIKLIPVSLTNVARDDSGGFNYFGIDFLRTSVHRDTRLDRNVRLSISAAGIDVRRSRQIRRNINFILAAAGHLLGIRAQESHLALQRQLNDGRTVNLHARNAGFQVGSAEALMGIFLHTAGQVNGLRITLGASADMGVALTNADDPGFRNPVDDYNINDRRSGVAQTDLSAFGEVGIQFVEICEIFGRLSITQLRENARNSPPITRSMVQFMAGGALHF